LPPPQVLQQTGHATGDLPSFIAFSRMSRPLS
jgi:hypothetical protein